MKRFSSMILPLLILVATGCATSTPTIAPTEEPRPAPERVSIQFWTYEAEEEQLAVQQALTTQFMAKFPDIEVKVIPINRNEYIQRLLAAAQADDLPDVIYIPSDFVFILANQDQEIFDTRAATEVMNELGMGPGEGHIPAIPADGWKLLLVYRKDLFEAYGLDVPDTWENILQAAEALHNPPELWGIEIATDPGSPYTTQVFNWFALSNGALPLDENGEITLNTSEFIETLEYYRELATFILPEYVGWERARSDYLEGRAAMIIWPSHILDELAGLSDDVSVVDPQLYEKTSFVSSITGLNGIAGYSFVNCLGITVNAETEAAEEWVKYLLSEGYFEWLSTAAPEEKIPLWMGEEEEWELFLDDHFAREFAYRRAPLSDFYSPEVVTTVAKGKEGFTYERWPFEAWGLPGDGMDVINLELQRFLAGETTASEAAQLMTERLKEAVTAAPLSAHWCPCVVPTCTSLRDCLNTVYTGCVGSGGGSWFCKVMAISHCLNCCCYLGGGSAR